MTALDRDEWLEWRRQGLGASDVAAVMGLSPWASPWSVWADKLGLAPGVDESYVMRRGRFMEPFLADELHRETGLYVVGEQTRCTHKEYPWARCTVDGFVAESPVSSIDDVLGGFEGKAVSADVWDEVPAHYRAQVQWSMWVTGLDHWWVYVDHRRTGSVYELERDDAFIAAMVEACRTFWFEHVVTQEPPPPDGSEHTREVMNTLWTPDPDETIEADTEMVDVLLRIDADDQRIKRLTETNEARKAWVKAQMRTASRVTCGQDLRGRPRAVATWSASRELNHEAFIAAHPDEAAAYLKPPTVDATRLRARKAGRDLTDPFMRPKGRRLTITIGDTR